jgi:NAD(P)-dependent dehydrogenase (short-subunit alcohol dehydrogenase family)
VALVVGASSGIGRATAHRLAGRAARLTLVARGVEGLEQVAEECRRAGAAEVVVRPVDVTDGAGVEAVVADLVERHGRIDLVVHAAAVMAYGTIEDLPPEVFETVVDVTVKGTANVARAVLPRMRAEGGGVLVIVTSLLASVPVPTIGAYITAKWGQHGLARILQLETRDAPDVHVCTVSPGAVDTPIYRRAARFGTAMPAPPPPVDPATRTARTIVTCLDHPRRRRSAGRANWFVVAGFRLLPGVYDALVGPIFRRTFSGPSGPPTTGNVFAPTHDDA